MRRWLIGVAGAVLLILGLGGAMLWVKRVDLLSWATTRLLERQGLGPASFTIDAVDLAGLSAHDVALGGGAFKASKLVFAFVPRDLVAGHLGSVEIDGLAVALTLGKDGIAFGGRPLATSSGGQSPMAGLSIDNLTLRDAHVQLDGPSGRIEATLAATLAVAGGQVTASAVTASVSGPVAGQRRTATIAAQRLQYLPQAAGGARITIAQATLTPEGMPWQVQGLDGELLWNPDRTTAQLSVGRLVNRQKPILVVPLAVRANASLVGSRLDFSLSADTGGKAPAKLLAKGRHELSSGKGSASVALGPVTFHRGSFQPGDLFPAFAGTVQDLDGSVGLAGTIGWSAKGVTPDLTLSLKNLSLAAPGAQLSGVNGEIKLSSLWPPATPPGQTIAATIDAPGLPQARLSLTGQLAAKPAFIVEHAVLAVAGGEFATTPFTIDPAAPEVDTTLQVDHVDLAEITKLLGMEGLSGTGRLDGSIPLTLKGGKFAISGGKLAAREPGLIRYRPSNLPAAIAGAGKSVALALQALSDFHYDKLTLDLDKSSSGEGTVLLRLQGNNPAVLSGQAFNFNIRLDSNFDRLADIALLSLRSAAELLRRAVRRTGP